ncbi:hypothetical protein GWC77_26410 [Paraburkholderia sp. NMBU_R16]|uniref:hypothetical protein n=1 Tax=Paraburkholderia sp. NMBU_R16 TaxID=2698676 RepID=UPI0015631589|nr:hypothetical protein [Paraburkholderia sp. NMBU_R16]NRO99420.1 hypothetical protein [Paraburkholderia sp. NMBU_R16]
MKNGWQAPLGALALVVLFAAFMAKPLNTASDIAAWVQGVGSLLAIIAAVWIYARQYEDKKVADEAEIRAFVESIRDEVKATWGAYCIEMHSAVKSLEPGEYFNMIYPVSVDAFSIYNASAHMVGKVDDPELRSMIVGTYVQAKGLINSFLLNNELLAEYKSLSRAYGLPNREAVLNAQLLILQSYASKLKERNQWVSNAVTALLTCIDQWLADHPPH